MSREEVPHPATSSPDVGKDAHQNRLLTDLQEKQTFERNRLNFVSAMQHGAEE